MLLQAPMPGDFIPIMGMVTGIISIIVVGVVVVAVARSALGQALARRISGKHGPGDEEVREEVAELREHLSHLEQRLLENEERLDFTERLLSRGPNEGKINGH